MHSTFSDVVRAPVLFVDLYDSLLMFLESLIIFLTLHLEKIITMPLFQMFLELTLQRNIVLPIKKNTLPFYASVQHVKNIEMMVECEECGLWRLLYQTCQLSRIWSLCHSHTPRGSFLTHSATFRYNYIHYQQSN